MEKLYIVIRESESGPEPDLYAVGWSRSRALEKALDANTKAPRWAAENPILRVAEFELHEVKQ